MSTIVHSPIHDSHHESSSSGTLLFSGIAMLVLGFLAIATPLLSSFVFESLLAWLLLFGGILRIVHAFEGRKKGGFLFGALFGLFTLAIGIGMLTNPGKGVLALTWLMAWYFIVGGVLNFIWSWSFQPQRGWGWMLFQSLLSILCGALVLAGWPVSAFWVLGTFVGIELIFSGFAILSFREHLKLIVPQNLAR